MRQNAPAATPAPFVVVCSLCCLAYGAASPDAPCPLCGDLSVAYYTRSGVVRRPPLVIAVSNPGGPPMPKGFQP